MLNDAQLRALFVGKSAWLQNNVTSDRFLIAWNKDGQRQIKYVNPTITVSGTKYFNDTHLN